MTPTARSLAYCRAQGWPVAVVEQRLPIPGKFITRDAFNLFDAIVILPGAILGVQFTSGNNHAARRDKVIANPVTRSWLAAGGKIAIWSWAKQGARGQDKQWTLRAEEIAL